MWKVSFKKDYKKVEVFNDRATVVTITATVMLPKNFARSIPIKINDWMLNHVNLIVDFDVFTSPVLTLKAKGKAVRSDTDKDNPLLAERLAECRAKMKIYKFMVTLTDNYDKYYMGVLMGENKMIYPTPDSDIPAKDSVWEANDRFSKLWNREYKLYSKLKDGD